MTITTKNRAIAKAVSCACAVLILGNGCTAIALNTAAHGIFPQEETNFNQQSYAVADYLIQQASTFIKRGDLIIAQPLSDSEQPGMSSNFSKMIPEQIGVRLSQLGYRMDLSSVASSPDTNYLKPSIANGEKPDFVLSGTYMRRRIEMDVSMRIVDIKAGRVIASYDYIMPLTREVNKLATPTPKIIRMSDQ